MVTDNSFADANEFPRPRLAVPSTDGTSLRPAHVFKKAKKFAFLPCALGWNRTNNSGLEVRSYIHLTTEAP